MPGTISLMLALLVLGRAPTVCATVEAGVVVDEMRAAPCGACPPCAPPSASAQATPPPQPKRFWLAGSELVGLQLLPLAVGNLQGNEYSKISLNSWKDNLENPWKWDNNHFINNQFSHPYHGAAYFNAARSNGYDFWASAVWPLVGSLTWEYFGEKYAPAPNDVLNTSIGGITLGESLWRLSSLVLDDRTQGRERVLREVGAGLINPTRGFTRLVTGETGRQGDNPDEWRPARIQGVFDAGYRRSAATVSLSERSTTQGFVGLSLAYGDALDQSARAPFSFFAFRAELARPGEVGLQTKTITTLQSSGTLAVWNLHESERSHIRFASLITYDYLDNPAYELGGQGVAFGLMTAPLDTGSFRVTVDALARGYAIAATFSDYFKTDEGRNYDYGPGYGAFGSVRLLWKGYAALSTSANMIWIETVSGVDGRHYESYWGADLRAYVSGKIGLGGLYRRYHRHSDYDDFTPVTFDASEGRIFLTVAMPGMR
jgi:Domain of unknown function (DUF3943)